jgi:guanylate kinase
MSGNVLIVTAPSGAGKTSLVRALLEQDRRVNLSVSYTTRAPRAGEKEGRDYHFVSVNHFMGMLEAGEFLESAEVYGNYYGTSEHWIRAQIAQGEDVLLEIDWQGAQQVRRLFPSAIGIFILPPSLMVLAQRLRERGQDDASTVARRMAAAREDVSHALEFDYVIINDDFNMALADLQAVVRAERLRVTTLQEQNPGWFLAFNS